MRPFCPIGVRCQAQTQEWQRLVARRNGRLGWLPAVGLILALALPHYANAQHGSSSEDAGLEDLLKKAIEANANARYEDAIKLFKEANKRKHGACYECYMGLTLAHSGLGDARSAGESAQKAVDLATDAQQRGASHSMKGSVLMRFAAGDLKQLAAAEGEFRQALAEDKDATAPQFQLGVVLLKEKRDEEGKKELKAYLSLVPAGSYAEQARQFIADPRRARDRFAPEFEATTLQQEKISLSQLSGKVVVLDFWATWCPPCRASLPELKDLLRKYPREKLVLISISADDDEKAWRDYIAKKAMDWPQVLDKDHQLRKLFHVNAFPTYLVIDNDGIIQNEIVGMNPQQSVAYRLKDALKSMKQLN